MIGIVISILLVTNVSIALDNSNVTPPKDVLGIGPNLAPNPSFEEGESLPTGWMCYSHYGNGTFHWDSTYAYAGEKSVGILNLTSYPGYLVELIWETTDFIPVDLHLNSYIFSVWIKYVDVPPSNQHAWIFIQYFTKDYQPTGGHGRSYIYTDLEWRLATLSTSYNENIKYAKLQLLQLSQEENTNPLLEIRFDDVYFGVWNTAPNPPTITGETRGKIRTVYDYTLSTIDPNQDKIQYEIDWGDNTTQTTDFYESGQEIIISHIWGVKGTYQIKVRATDDHATSDWVTLTVTMPLSYTPQFPFLTWLFERFPNAFPLLRHLISFA